MEHAKKMVLVDPRVLQTRMTAPEFPTVVDPIGRREPEVGVIDMTLRSLDQGLKNILDTPNIPEDEKAKLYGNYLQDYLTMKKKQSDIYGQPARVTFTSPPPQAAAAPTTTPGKDQVENQILTVIPRNMQKFAKLLVDRIKSDPSMDWNERGELVLEGRPLLNTNIVDLVKDLLYRRRTFNPLGWEEFATHLARGNIPHDLVRNPERLAFIVSRSQQEPLEFLPPESVQAGIREVEAVAGQTPKRKSKRKQQQQVKTWFHI